MAASPRSPAIAALLLATAGWGTMFLVGQPVLRRVDPVWFTLIRYSIAALLFAALLLPRGAAPWRHLRASAGPLALLGLVGFGVFSVLLLTGLAHSVPSHGAVIMATMPVTTQLLRWALDGVRPGRSAAFTAGLALAGVVTVSGLFQPGGGGGAAQSAWRGDAVVLAGTLGWVWYTRGAARFAGLGVLEYTGLTVLAAWPLLLAGALLATACHLASPPAAADLAVSWHALLYVGVVSSAISILAFNYGVRSLGAVTATAFLNFVPVSALLASVAIGKPPAAHELLGTAMVIGALLIHTARAGAAAAPAAACASGRNACVAVRG